MLVVAIGMLATDRGTLGGVTQFMSMLRVGAKPLNANRLELNARIVCDVCDNQWSTARKLLILKTERCPSG